MPFPDAARTIYRQNPLAEVICQLRFPTILRIDAEREPAALFQERIRGQYPLYEEKPLAGASLPAQLQQLINLPGGQLERHFFSDDQLWHVSLNRDFIALSCKRYTRWEAFQQHLENPRASFEEVYAPSFYSRIGLRYKNVIQRSRYNLNGVGWGELLKPHVAAEFSSADIVADINQSAHQVSFKLDQFEGIVQVRHGLTDIGGEQCYTIDADFFANARTELNNVAAVLDYFNGQTRRLFHWCITERLHEAMEPDPVAV
jgi:uncharacterized protein (TIGR04255 family)